VTAGDVWRSFGRWRHRRPFWGCFFFILSGAELFYTANQSLGGITLHLGPTGFLSYVLPLIMVICGLLCLFTPAQRLFYGIVGLLAALYSFIGLNLGGFFLGMLFGIIGGALVIAWGPPRPRPVNPDFVPIADQIEEASASSASDASSSDAETEHVEVAGHDDRPTEEHVRPAAAQDPGIVPGFDDDQEGPKSGSTRSSRLSKNPKALTVALIVIGLTAAMLAVGSRVPASADDACPKGMPSRSASATSTTAAAEKAAAGSAGSAASAAKKAASAAKKKATTTGTTTAPDPSPSKSGSGNKIVDGVQSIIDGVGNLLGLGDDPSSSPSASPSPSETPTTAQPTTTGDPDPTKTAEPTSTATGQPSTSVTGSGPASASASPSDDIIPCLGARVFGLAASADDVPLVGDKPGLLETDLLTMYNSTYDGVVTLTTGSGNSVRALKFSMDRAVNQPFSLTIAGNGGQTVITSNELATIGTVKFYTQRIEGKLFGLIPVVFTPDQPPPLTLPILWFTDVKIQLNYVRCDTLTGIPLDISQQN
jgi:hypothetical protein